MCHFLIIFYKARVIMNKIGPYTNLIYSDWDLDEMEEEIDEVRADLGIEKKCSICRDNIKSNQVSKIDVNKIYKFDEMKQLLAGNLEVTQLKCQHLFHTHCVQGWVNQAEDKTTPSSCPDCRTDICQAGVQPPAPASQSYRSFLAQGIDLGHFFN